MSLSRLISDLPREIRLEILQHVDPLSQAVVRHVLLGVSLTYSKKSEKYAYIYGLNFFLWCNNKIQLYKIALRIGEYGDTGIANWARDRYPSRAMAFGAIKRDRLDILEHLGTSQEDWTCRYSPLLELAIRKNSIRCMVWLYEHKHRMVEPCELAASHGAFECLEYLHKNGNRLYGFTSSFTISLKILQYARENGCVWNPQTCANAAAHGRLDVLQYVHENGCPWDSNTCISAAVFGHLECLQYAHENGCRWLSDVPYVAAQRNHLGCLQYAMENGCPCDPQNLQQVYITSVNCDSFECFRYLRQKLNLTGPKIYPLSFDLASMDSMDNPNNNPNPSSTISLDDAIALWYSGETRLRDLEEKGVAINDFLAAEASIDPETRSALSQLSVVLRKHPRMNRFEILKTALKTKKNQ